MKVNIHDLPGSWDATLANYGAKEPCQAYAMHSAYIQSMNASRAILIEVFSANGFVLYPVLLIPVPSLLTHQDLFTAESVYGFSGPVCSGDRDFLIKAFEQISAMFSDLGVIAEFVRVSPFIDIPTPLLVECGYMFQADRALAIWRRQESLQEGSQYIRFGNMERRALKAGCQFSVDSVSVNEFQELYLATMRLNSAADFFMYSPDYFNRLNLNSVYLTSHFLGVRLGSRLISSALFIVSGDHAVYHLGCNDRSIPGASDLLLRCSTDYLVNRFGVSAINFTGGRSLDPNDSLLKFKMRFATHAEQFFVGRRIINPYAFNCIVSTHSEKVNPLHLIPWR